LKEQLEKLRTIGDRIQSFDESQNKSIVELQRNLASAELELRQSYEEKSKLSVQLLKDRKLYRTNVERVKDELSKAQIKNEELKELVRQKSANADEQIRSLMDRFELEKRKSVSEEVDLVKKNYELKLTHMNDQLQQSHMKVESLDKELREIRYLFDGNLRNEKDISRSMSHQNELIQQKLQDSQLRNEKILANSKELVLVIQDLKKEVCSKNEQIIRLSEESKVKLI
jgi:hypothetical protein